MRDRIYLFWFTVMLGPLLIYYGIAHLWDVIQFRSLATPMTFSNWQDLYGNNILAIIVGLFCVRYSYRKLQAAFRRRREIESLKWKGKTIWAEVEDIFLDSDHHFVVRLSYSDPQTQERYSLQSDPVWNLPNPMSTSLMVYVNPASFRSHFVDINSFQKLKVG